MFGFYVVFLFIYLLSNLLDIKLSQLCINKITSKFLDMIEKISMLLAPNLDVYKSGSRTA